MIPIAKTLFSSTLMVLLSASFALCASVTVVPTGNGTFSVKGDSMNGVAGIELTLTYDSSSLATPTVALGSLVSGALLAANTTVPGSIKIAIISTSPFSGSGQIASISFASHSGSGGITSVKSNLIDSSGAAVASQADVANSTTSPTPLSPAAGLPFQTPQPTTSSTPTYLGTVSMPSDGQAKTDTKPADTTGGPVQPTEPAAVKPVEPPAVEKPASEPPKPEKVTVTSYKGTLENFREYKGEKSPAKLVALFNKEISPMISQEPAIALSDGKTPVRILAKIEGVGDNSPNFALNGAKLVSLNKDDATRTWIIEALPQSGVMQATLTILTDSNTIEYPLTVAPSAVSISLTEADFVLFLKDSGTAKPKHDLNGDGRHDFQDDFIYTAHFLLKKGATGRMSK